MSISTTEQYLTQQEIEAVKKPLETAQSIPTRCYTDPKFYATEEEHIFRRNWLCAGRIDQIPNPGDYFTLDLLNEPLVIVRDQEQNIHALSRICRHRWMPVVTGSGNAKSFQCPYHAWTYALSGELLNAPRMEQTVFDKVNCRLPSIRVEVWQGFIFVNFDQNAKPLAPQLTTLDNKLAGYQLSSMRCTEAVVYESKWNWKVMLENASEVYHLVLHKNVLISNMPTKFAIIEDNDGPYTYSRIPSTNREPLPTVFPTAETLNPDQLSEFSIVTVFPYHLFVLNPDQMAWVQILPQSVDRHIVRIHLCFHPSAFNDPKFEQKLKLNKWFLDQIHQEDMYACENVQRGLSSKLSQPTQFSYLEKAVWQFQQWLINQII